MDILLCLAFLKLSRLAGWVVGKSDFNENPVVSLDLDLDFGLRLRVCQKEKTSCRNYYKKEGNDDPKNLIEFAKDALVIKNKVEEEGVGYLRFCSVKQIKSMCLAAKILKSSFESNPLIQDKYPHC